MVFESAADSPIRCSVLSGQRVMLRPFTQAEITEQYIRWLNDPIVLKFSNQRFVFHDRASCLRYLESFAGTDNLFLSVFRLENNKPIGTLTAYISRHHGTADVGIMIGDRTVWGRGYGQDAWNTLTNWLIAEARIRKLTGGTVACNRAMVKLMERSGMKLEAVRKAQEIIEGQPQDLLYFAKFYGP